MMKPLEEALRATEERDATGVADDYAVMARARVRRATPRPRPVQPRRRTGRGDLLGLVITAQLALLTFVALLAPRRG